MTTSRRPRSDGERTRALILDATVTLIAQVGLAGTTQRRVAAAAGVSLASVTYHFATLADLIDAAIQHASQRWIQAFEERRDLVLRGELDLVESCLRASQTPHGEPEPHAVVVFTLLISAVQRPELRARVTELIERLRDVFAPWIARTDFTLGGVATFLGLGLLNFAASAHDDVKTQMASMLEHFGVTETIAAHRTTNPST
ncbi:TetR family transcriptional regulator [Luteimicrobium xylanilyticum]|uniref:HTH tetR-type domain-containing protein n=1 Tax=Luteimicrobium xylanilyticum TaxID=1133546 RepID=A0A5P9QFM7_9MICO|nr:TetR family transcriptional regulator [Luteimicrobium xylanilyticum]QFV00050.1 hypothetical protein KDY119_03585 [Luteimicrobium xylanilyticum]